MDAGLVQSRMSAEAIGARSGRVKAAGQLPALRRSGIPKQDNGMSSERSVRVGVRGQRTTRGRGTQHATHRRNIGNVDDEPARCGLG
jgi:hypothetical protein